MIANDSRTKWWGDIDVAHDDPRRTTDGPTPRQLAKRSITAAKREQACQTAEDGKKKLQHMAASNTLKRQRDFRASFSSRIRSSSGSWCWSKLTRNILKARLMIQLAA